MFSMFAGTSPGPPVTPTSTKTTPLHEALKLKKLHDAAVQEYMEKNKDATPADLEKFKEQFVVAQTRLSTTGSIISNSSSSGQKLPQQSLPINRNLTGAFFDPNDEHSNVRPTVFLGRQEFSPPKVQVPLHDDSSSVGVPFDDVASMSSDGMSAAMTMQTSSKPKVPPPETPTAPKPSVSVFTPPLWPFPSLQNKESQQEQSSITLWPFGTTVPSSSSSSAAAVPTQPTIIIIDENHTTTPAIVQPSAINIDNNAEQPQIPSSPNLIIWPFSTARFAPVMPFSFGTAEVPVSQPVGRINQTRAVDMTEGDTIAVATMSSAVSPRKQNRRDLNGYVDVESTYLDSSMAGFVANKELIQGRINELERGAHGSDGGFFPPIENATEAAKVELATLRLLDKIQKERDSAEQEKQTASTLIVKLGGQQQRDLSLKEQDMQAFRTQIASLEADNQKMRQTNEELNGRVQHDKGEVERLLKLLNDANTATGRTERALGDLTAQRAIDTAENDILRRQVADMKEKNSVALQDAANLTQKLAKEQEEKKLIEQDKTNLQLQLAGVLSTVEAQRHQLSLLENTKHESENAIATLKQQIKDIQQSNEGSGANIASLHQHIAYLESMKLTSDTTIGKLETQRQADQMEINRLKSIVQTNTDTITQLNTQIASIQDTIPPPLPSAIKKEQEEAIKALANLKKQREKDAAELERLRKEKERLEGELQKTPLTTGSSTAINHELQQELDAMARKKSALENQARVDQNTIATLRSQLEAYNKLNEQSEEVDKRRVKDLKAVNDWLLRLALDTAFQDDLKRPLVNVALNCWGGTGHNLPEDQLEAARYDEGVVRVYPLLKEFEVVCNAANIRFPIDHLIARKTQLSVQHVLNAFGSDFVAKHHILGGGAQSTSVSR